MAHEFAACGLEECILPLLKDLSFLYNISRGVGTRGAKGQLPY